MDVEDFDRVLTWLEPVDRERVEEDATLAAHERFARTGDFEVDAQRFRDALDAETRTLNEARERRDRAAVALSRYWVLRPGANLAEAMGVSRAAWSAIRRRYEGRPVRGYRTAGARLGRYAALVVRAERTLAIGREARDALAQEMVDAGMTNTQIATRLGLSQPQVSRLVEWKSKSGMMYEVAGELGHLTLEDLLQLVADLGLGRSGISAFSTLRHTGRPPRSTGAMPTKDWIPRRGSCSSRWSATTRSSKRGGFCFNLVPMRRG